MGITRERRITETEPSGEPPAYDPTPASEPAETPAIEPSSIPVPEPAGV